MLNEQDFRGGRKSDPEHREIQPYTAEGRLLTQNKREIVKFRWEKETNLEV